MGSPPLNGRSSFLHDAATSQTRASGGTGDANRQTSDASIGRTIRNNGVPTSYGYNPSGNARTRSPAPSLWNNVSLQSSFSNPPGPTRSYPNSSPGSRQTPSLASLSPGCTTSSSSFTNPPVSAEDPESLIVRDLAGLLQEMDPESCSVDDMSIEDMRKLLNEMGTTDKNISEISKDVKSIFRSIRDSSDEKISDDELSDADDELSDEEISDEGLPDYDEENITDEKSGRDARSERSSRNRTDYHRISTDEWTRIHTENRIALRQRFEQEMQDAERRFQHYVRFTGDPEAYAAIYNTSANVIWRRLLGGGAPWPHHDPEESDAEAQPGAKPGLTHSGIRLARTDLGDGRPRFSRRSAAAAW